MFNLYSLSISNFLSIESMHFNFTKHGNYLITGFNEVGGDSNGSGKSAILNSIIWCLTGKTAKGLTEVTSWDSKKEAAVSLDIKDSEGTIYSIIRTSSSLRFIIDRVETSGHKKDIQQSIYDTFHTSYDLILSSIMFTKGQADFLTDAGDAAKKRLFKSLLNLDKIDKLYEKIKDSYGALSKDALDLETSIKIKKSQIEAANKAYEEYLDSRVKYEDRRRETISQLEKQLEKDEPDIDKSFAGKMDSSNKNLDLLVEKLHAMEESLPEIQEELKDIYGLRGYYEQEKHRLEAEIASSKDLGGSNCRYCGAALTKKNLWKHIQDKEKLYKDLEIISDTVAKRMMELEKQIYEIDKTRDLEAKVHKEYEYYSTLVREQDNKLAMFNETKKHILLQIKSLKEDKNVYEELANRKAEEVVVLKENLEELQKEFESVTKKIDVCSYVKWVLSREGVVSVIIQRTFSRLESLINQYLNRICSEKLQIKISPKKELKSGAMRDEIDIVVTKNGRKIPYSALSGGQEQRVTVATLLAIYKLSKELGMNKFNFLLLDEVLDLSLAEKGQDDIIALLESMQEIRNIFIISHKDNLANSFSMQIDVRLHKDGITRLEGVYN